jgi:hypothetical protein
LWNAQTNSLAAEGFLSLTSELVLLVVIACREVEGNKAGYLGSPCNVTGLVRGQMAFFRGNVRINVEERRLDEKLIGTIRQCDDFFDVLVVIATIDR